MRIDGMDASYKVPEFPAERQPAQPQIQQAPVESPQKAKADQKNPQEIGSSPEANGRLVRMAVEKANKQMSIRETSLRFETHEKTGDMIVRIVDTNTKEVIREIPSEKILDMVANMLEMAGILVDERR